MAACPFQGIGQARHAVEGLPFLDLRGEGQHARRFPRRVEGHEAKRVAEDVPDPSGDVTAVGIQDRLVPLRTCPGERLGCCLGDPGSQVIVLGRRGLPLGSQLDEPVGAVVGLVRP